VLRGMHDQKKEKGTTSYSLFEQYSPQTEKAKRKCALERWVRRGKAGMIIRKIGGGKRGTCGFGASVVCSPLGGSENKSLSGLEKKTNK